MMLGEKLFVYRTYDHTLEHSMQVALADAVGGFGNGVLCYVQTATDDHAPFTAVRKSPNLIVGYIDRFVPVEHRLDYNDHGWEAVCRAALNVWLAEDTGPPAPSAARQFSRLRGWLGLS